MLNEDRLRVMTRLGLEEEKQGAESSIAENISRRDYVSFHGAVGFFTGSLLFCLLYGLIGCGLFFTKIYALTEDLIRSLFIVFCVGYVAFIFLFVLSVRRRARRRYNEADGRQREISGLDRRLLQLYDEEEETMNLRTLAADPAFAEAAEAAEPAETAETEEKQDSTI